MPYFNNSEINLLFIHIPKTGGTSLELYFSNKYNIKLDNKSLYFFLDKNNKISYNYSLQHMTYKNIIDNSSFLNINFDNISIITIVRNPYERIISDLFFYKKINVNSSKEEVTNIIKNQYLSINQLELDNHNIPQYLYITVNNELIPNIKILRTESLEKDMIDLGYTDFNIRSQENPHKVDYYNYLNNESIKLINDFYDYDFKLLNYKKIDIQEQERVECSERE